MQKLSHILILVLTAILGSSCRDTAALTCQEAPQSVCVQAEARYEDNSRILYGEGITSSPISLSRIVFHSEKRVETRTGERTEPSPRGGGKALKAYHALRTAIHLSVAGCLQHRSMSVCPFASHTPLIYVLRHIIR